MGATSFERQRRTAAAREIMEMIEGHELKAFIADFSLMCEPKLASVEEALSGRTDYVELKEKVALWCDGPPKADEGPKVSKAARTLAKAEEIDLSTIEGSGANGGITVTDVKNAIAARDAEEEETGDEEPAEEEENEDQ